jgi:pimeloyl-ACP methyl ester carboxylesterase
MNILSPDSKASEDPFFFTEEQGRRLFGILHSPGSNPTSAFPGKVAIIYCHPLFEEKLHSHRIGVNFARYAAKRGYPVLRFDYWGDGESDGLFEEASVTSRVSNIHSAIEEVRRRVSPAQVYIVGLRLGATLALKASLEGKNIAGVVAWAPILDLKTYLHELLKANLAAQMALHKKILHNREMLVEHINNGGKVNLDGYEVCNPFFQEAVGIDWLDQHLSIHTPVCLVQISSSSKIDKVVDGLLQRYTADRLSVYEIREREFWMAQRVVYPSCQDLYSSTLGWISETHEQRFQPSKFFGK